VALSAFSLSSLSTPIARKQLIKEMWESGADVFVLIDHNTLAGFQSVAEARAQLLKLGRKEIAAAEFAKSSETANAPSGDSDLLVEDDVTEGKVNLEAAAASGKLLGTHVVAPCPHDGACPLFHPERKSDKLVCGFSQRIQRPSFVRRTKHSGVGHEDIGYSYVVVRRGPRPEPLTGGQPLLGREGMVALRAAARRAARDADSTPREMEEYEAGKDYFGEEAVDVAESSTIASVPVASGSVEAALRAEAYQWPRLVFPPLKRSGHVVLDVCAPDARIVRATIPKSQGAQAYYDARKASWGDIFPHAPKNRVQERYTPAGGKVQGSDIGKRGVDDVGNEDMRKRPGYGKIAKEVLKQKKERRREIRDRRQEKYEAGT
jgi:ribosomal protein RSM22 (predicted rRNA methylase)